MLPGYRSGKPVEQGWTSGLPKGCRRGRSFGLAPVLLAIWARANEPPYRTVVRVADFSSGPEDRGLHLEPGFTPQGDRRCDR